MNRSLAILICLFSLALIAGADEVDNYLAARPLLQSAIDRATGGGPTTTNTAKQFRQVVDSATTTNAVATLASGALYFPLVNYGQAGTGNDNQDNGVQFMNSGFDGTPNTPPGIGNLPNAAIRAFAGWGGYRYDNTTLHIYSRGDIRIEPCYSGTNYGYGYMSLGNEDQANRMSVNYLNPSIHVGGDNQAALLSWAVGHGLSLDFPAQTRSNNVTLWSNAAIQGWGGNSNSAKLPDGSLAGQLYFWRKAPAPLFAGGGLDFGAAVLGGRMSDTGWDFYGSTTATNLTASDFYSASGVSGTVNYRHYLYIGGGGSRYTITDNSATLPAVGPYQGFVQPYNSGYHGYGVGTLEGQVTDFIMSRYNFVLVEENSAKRLNFDMRYNTNTISGFTVFTNGIGLARLNVSLTADNQVVGAGTNAFLFISSDNATATSRTFVLTTATDGKILRIAWSGTNAGELVDDSANNGTGNVRLSATWTPTQYDTITLLGVGTDWYEVTRSAN